MTQEEKARLRLLADRYLKDTISDNERTELEAWFRQQRDEPLDIPAGFAEDEEELERRIFATIETRTRKRNRPQAVRLWPRIAAAASILFVIGIGGYFILHKKQSAQLAQNDIAPFSKQAILKTGHGKTLTLDSNAKGTLAKYANTQIRQNNGQEIAYTNNTETDEKVIFDTLQVPAGGKPYHLRLADGS